MFSPPRCWIALPTIFEKFDALSKDEFVVFLEPPSLDARIVNQFALFSLMNNPAKGLDKLLDDHPDLAKRIIIPAELKWEIRDKLDQSGITERMLYPGLDGLSRWLSRYYTPSQGSGRLRPYRGVTFGHPISMPWACIFA